MKKQRQKNQKGYSLFEIIIYVSILAMIVVSFITFTIAITNAKSKVYVVQEVNSNLRIVLNLVSQKIRAANSVISPVSGNSDQVLILDMPNPSADITFDLNGGVLFLTEGVNEPIAITSSEIEVTDLEFINLATSGKRDSIKIKISAKYRFDPSQEFKYSNTFETSVSTRK